MINDISQITHDPNFHLFIKVVALVVIGLFGVFSFMLATKIRSFNKILFLPPNSGGSFMQRLAVIYSLVVLVLFILAIIMI